MATRRMRIKAVINVPRSTVKAEPVEQSAPGPGPPVSGPEAVPSPGQAAPSSPLQIMPPRTPESMEMGHPDPSSTPPPPSPSNSVIDRITTSPKSPRSLQRPSPSKSPACLLPASGTILRRSPSPALSRLTNSPGPPVQYPPSPVKSPGPIQNYVSPSSPLKILSRSPVVIIPTMMVQAPGSSSSGGRNTPVESLKSPPSYPFRPPPSPSPSHHHHHHDFHPINSPGSPATSILSRPSPSQSPVLVGGGGNSRGSTSFLYHHLNSNSNSADSHEVAQLMSSSSEMGGDKKSSSVRGSSGAFSSVSNKINSTPSPSPSFSKTMFEDPDSLKRRLEEKGKKEVHGPPTKFAAVRKEFYEKLHSGNLPAKLTMLHYTFYNPPDPNGTKAKKKNRSRASSICSDVSTISKQDPDAPANNENKAASAPSSIAGSRRTTASSVASGASAHSAVPSEGGQSDHGSVASNASAHSTDSNVPGPRVKVGPNGELIIDEKSLVVETSESQRARQQIENMEVVLGAETSGMYRYKRAFRRGSEWTERETIRFYRALNQCGTDFSMMLNLFPGRTRHELKSKFKREDKKNPDMISMALQSCVFDPNEKFSDDEEVEEDVTKSKSMEGMTEKEKLLQEEKEQEEVIADASADADNPKKKLKKEKEFQFSTAQLQEINKTKALFKGPGLGKGRKWNTPVVGLEGKKLPPEPPKKVKIKQEKDQEKKKEVKKKKKPEPVSVNTITPGTVSIIIAPGVLSAPIQPFKQEKQDPPTVNNNTSAAAPANAEKGKKRIRLPKAKPNVSAKKAKKDVPKKPTLPLGMCDDLFRFDPNEAPSVPSPLPVAQETELVGDEEGTDGLVIVDLEELKTIQAQASDACVSINITTTTSVTATAPTVPVPVPSTTSSGESKRRKRTKVTPVPVTRRIVGDPYQKTTLTTTVHSSDDANSKLIGGNGGEASSSKKVKVLPYRVPGPGGVAASSPVADEVQLEFELNPGTGSGES